jgi:hypothetical protein
MLFVYCEFQGDRHTAESDAFIEEFKRKSSPSRLQEKLREIRGE